MRSRAALVGLVIALGACAPAERLFPLRAPMTVDAADLAPVSVPCHPEPTPKEPDHVSCAPAVAFSPTIWDGTDNMLFRPLSEALGVVVSGEATDVTSLDEVPDSSWFTNRVGARPMTLDDLARGACTPKELLDPDADADGTWVIDKGKTDGETHGFRVNIAGHGKFMLKAEPKDQPERPSAASVVGALVYHAAGYYTTCEQIVYVRPSLLKLTPGLKSKGNFGEERTFDAKALAAILAESPHDDGRVRLQASKWLPGYPIGPFQYFGTRDDDPNDVVPHEDRRELRGMRVLNAWIERHDARSGNTFDAWFADGAGEKRPPDASPGHVVHYHLDTSEALGSGWAWNEISRRLGHSYVVDWGYLATDFFTLGTQTRPWDHAAPAPGLEIFGYFDVDGFVPDAWKMEYPNAAFSRMTERDGAWMARILARFTPAMIERLAERARFTNPVWTEHLVRVLEGRLDKILARYLTRVSSIADVRVEGKNRVCGVDLAEKRGVRDAAGFRYTARANGAALEVARGADGALCVTVPHVEGDVGPPDDARERYVRVRIDDGVAPGPLVVHLYDLGPTRGLRLVGLERPDP